MSNLMLLGNKHLHSLLYIVADQPSNKNLSPSVPLVGTSSYKNLLNWFANMDVDITRVRFYNQADGPFDNQLSLLTLNKAIELEQIKVIALGQRAAKYLDKAGVEEYYILPHPSPRNRQLNDPEFIKGKLAACQTYIYQGIIYEKESKESITEDLQSEQELQSGE